MSNRLASETSPYLLQHAHNPVDWYPWGDEAFEVARRDDRPLLLSIGYSACHWCHVMERESFEDPAVAEVMNRDFVNVKVDREERPDVDGVYMRAVQAMTGRGGWPLTAFLTPDGVPFYGGTYYPPEPRHGMPSFRQVLEAISEAYRERRDDVLRSSDRLREALEHSVSAAEPGRGLDAELVLGAVRHLAGRFDAAHGGFGGAPKFPQPTTLEFLLAHGVTAGDRRAVDMVVTTLRAMAAGGLRDHLGGGFHRYSVDARWLVPHFEKMLYDNALLARLYVDAWRATGHADLRAVAEETLDWVVADMRAPEGGFYSARDADSEGEEGLFYVWTPEQVEAAGSEAGIAPEDLRLFRRVYDVEPGGNFEGRSILHLPHPLAAVAAREGVSPGEIEARLAPVRRALLAARSRREPPLRDEKVLASWTAFAVRALAEAGGALGRPDFVEAAAAGARFVLEAMHPDGRPVHVWTKGRAHVDAFLEDRAGLGNALVSLHEATLDPAWLRPVDAIVADVLTRYHDEEEACFYDGASDGERLLVRAREAMDQATPSGSSLAVELLLRAGHLLERPEWTDTAVRALERESGNAARFPAGYGRLLAQVVAHRTAPEEVAIVGRDDDPVRGALHRTAMKAWRPGRIVTGAGPDDEIEGLPLLEGRTPREGGAVAYHCRAYVCEAPTSDPDELARSLASDAST